jgi:hypothetical protein
MSPALGYEYQNERPDVLREFSAGWDSIMEVSDPPPEIDYGHGLAIRNQANRPSCRGHSLAACGRMGARLASGSDIDLNNDGKAGEPVLDDFSPLWCWVRTQIHGGTVGAQRGATMSGGVKAAMQDGFATEADWPYSKQHTTQFPADVAAKAKLFTFKRYATLSEEQQVHDWLASGQGPCEWGKTWPFAWRGGCLVESSPGRGGGHATAIRGYWTGARVAREVPGIADRVRNEPYVYVCENSHGSQAQFKGLYFVSRAGMAATLRNAQTHLLGWSDMASPLVRKFNWAAAKIV